MSWIGIDLGATKVYGVVHHGDKVKAEAKRKTPSAGGPGAVVDTIVDVVKDLGGTDGVKGVGVGAPGAGGRLCGCGHRGHLEAYAGRASMEREARERDAHGTPTKLVELAGKSRVTSSVWANALQARDVVALELLDDAVAALGAAVSNA